jgi:hypothetical protein
MKISSGKKINQKIFFENGFLSIAMFEKMMFISNRPE